MPSTLVLVALALGTATVGSLGGLGGAVFLVPALVLFGVEPQVAAPLGILSVAAGSLASAPRQLSDGLVHQRLGVTLELMASAGAITGALLGDAISATALSVILALTALGAAMVGLRRRGLRNPPRGEFSAELPGEWAGSLAGAYRLDEETIVPYQAKRAPLGVAAMAFAGLISGLAGVGGGFIKTPTMTEVMHVPVKVAAATTTFTVGVTAAASLLVFAGQGRIDEHAGAAVVFGGLIGGFAGSRLQILLPPARVRVVLSVALIVVAGLLLVTL